MNDKTILRVSVVSYLNSKPFIYGIRKSSFEYEIEISEDTPSDCAEKLINGKADIGLVPVVVLPFLKNHSIITEYCIGSDGAVNSVLLLSDVPMKNIKTILLDYQSRTSLLLTRILAEKFWLIHPIWKNTKQDYEKQINNETAGIVIGDRALLLKNKFKYVYDLSDEWKKFTSLPFVFACWVSVQGINKKFISDFNIALGKGLSMINEIASKECSEQLSEAEIQSYLNDFIDYDFNEKKKSAMKLFLNLAEEIEVVTAL